MPTARVVCPTCATPLELDRGHLGQEVQCGSCNQVFVAKAEKRSRDDEDDDRPRKKKSRFARRDDDDEDDDDYDRRPRRRSSSGSTNGLGVASMVIGLCGLVAWCCTPAGLGLAVIGGLLGIIGLSSPNRGPAVAGVVLNGLFLFLNGGMFVVGMGLNLMGPRVNNNNNNGWNQPAPPQGQWPPPRRRGWD